MKDFKILNGIVFVSIISIIIVIIGWYKQQLNVNLNIKPDIKTKFIEI